MSATTGDINIKKGLHYESGASSYFESQDAYYVSDGTSTTVFMTGVSDSKVLFVH